MADSTLTPAESYPVPAMLVSTRWKVDITDNVSTMMRNNVAVCSTADILNTNLLNNSLYMNADVIIHAVNHMTGNDMVPITGKAVDNTAVTFSAAATTVMKWLFVLAVPGLTLIIGLVVYYRRRHL